MNEICIFNNLFCIIPLGSSTFENCFNINKIFVKYIFLSTHTYFLRILIDIIGRYFFRKVVHKYLMIVLRNNSCYCNICSCMLYVVELCIYTYIVYTCTYNLMLLQCVLLSQSVLLQEVCVCLKECSLFLATKLSTLTLISIKLWYRSYANHTNARSMSAAHSQ